MSLRGNALSQCRRQRIDAAAFDAVLRDDDLAARCARLIAERHVLERLAFEPLPKRLAPCDAETGIRRFQFADRDPLRRQDVAPVAIRSQPRPACAAECEDRRARLHALLALRRLETQRTILVPAKPSMTKREPHAKTFQPRQPCAQQRRGLEGFGKDPPARADEGVLPEPMRPVAQRLRRKRLDRRAQKRRRVVIARKENIERLAVGEVEPAPPGHQKFTRDRRHPVVHDDRRACRRHRLGRDQTGRTGPDNGNIRRAHDIKPASSLRLLP
ncbi:hypothetical protein BN961_01733 [Afipia felis]|uniref:Uncharacterized protein n=1 Tax=Afipia felis TaxID=1035 RepID=A0A090MRU5_AFIFE|nr:hypothetical protein BN961_01733 [Afipia felis]